MEHLCKKFGQAVQEMLFKESVCTTDKAGQKTDHNMSSFVLRLAILTLASMISLSLFRSSKAGSQFCISISEASLPQRAFK